MAELLDSNGFRVLAYLLVATLALAARPRERRRAAGVDGVWVPFWYLTAGLLLAMAIGRIGDLSGLLTELGRDRAHSGGWYASRRPLQAAIVIAVAATWFVLVAWAVWRVPERRRRYLPMSVAVVTLVAYAAIRLVSLHYVDAVLHRRHLAGVKFGAVIELLLLAASAIVTTWIPKVETTADADGGAGEFRRVSRVDAAG